MLLMEQRGGQQLQNLKYCSFNPHGGMGSILSLFQAQNPREGFNLGQVPSPSQLAVARRVRSRYMKWRFL